ncbi:MAG: Asp23/Gls24 family envelope stress response protein [Lachnospiraceae bacterium]|nr:Asp23/Gls24 family envelope stress response protein [Lachnospiraceae bacterium]
MKANIQTDHGEVVIDTDVIAKYAGAVAVECFGVVGMATTNVMEGITSLLKKENLSQGISVNVADGKLCLDFHIIVAYGVSISAVSENLIENVRYKVETFTGIPVDKVNIYVEGVRLID